MKHSATHLLAALATAGMTLTPAYAPEPTGTWLTEDKRARVRTERCGPGNPTCADTWSGAASRSV
ncbi:hypothetical protein ACYQR9_21540 [Methylobacterium sp. CM6241]